MANEVTNINANGVASPESGRAAEHLVFVSEELHYVISVTNITEIIMNHTITRMPKVPDFIKGVINLRGQVIPIIDVRARMNRPSVEYSSDVCIIVINVDEVDIGLLVERVSHVVNISPDQVSEPPANNRQDLVRGIANLDGKVYLVMDCDKLVQY